MMQIVGRIGHFLRSLLLRSGMAMQRFPWAVVVIVGASILANLSIADARFLDAETQNRLFAALCAAAAASVSAKLFAEGRGTRSLLAQLVSALFGFLAAALVWFAEPLAIPILPLIAGLAFLVPLAPFPMDWGGSDRFWSFTYWTAVGAALAFLSIFVFVLGLHAIVEMAGYLFDLPVPSGIFDHVYVTAGTLVGPLFALGRVPARFDVEAFQDAQDPARIGLGALFGFVAIPLTLLTALILHLYSGRILLTQDLPKNQVGWIVLVFLVLILGLRVAAHPFVGAGRGGVGGIFRRFWPFILVVPLGLLAYALGLRIISEGLTIERYYLALAAVATAAVLAIQVLPRTRQDIRLIAGVPIVLLIVTSFGPWGAYASVARSQVERVLALISMPHEGRAYELNTRLREIQIAGGIDRLLLQLPPAARVAYERSGNDWDRIRDLVAALGFEEPGSDAVEQRTAVFAADRPISLAGFDGAVQNLTLEPGVPQGSTGVTAELLPEGVLTVTLGTKTDRFDLNEAVQSLYGGNTGNGVVDLSGSGGRHLRLVVNRIYESVAEPRRPVLVHVTLLYRQAEWGAD